MGFRSSSSMLGRGLEVTERMEAARNRAGRQKRVIPLRSLRPSPQTQNRYGPGARARSQCPCLSQCAGWRVRVYQPQPLSESLHFLIHLGANHPMPIIRPGEDNTRTVWRTRDPTPRPSSAQEPRSHCIMDDQLAPIACVEHVINASSSSALGRRPHAIPYKASYHHNNTPYPVCQKGTGHRFSFGS